MPFPYTFPFDFYDYSVTPFGDYVIEVDWDNDGDFDGTYDDITSDVTYMKFTRGKDEELGKVTPASLEIRVNNSTGKYSPTLTTGDLYEKLLPKRVIRVREYGANSGLVTPLFYGYIESIIPHPHLSEQDAFISAIDGLDFLARHELDTVLYTDELTGTLVGNILDSAAWSATLRSIDAGQDTVPFAYWHKVRALTSLHDIEDSELGFIYVDSSGNLGFEDRHHRYTATHQTSQATFDDTMAQITFNYSAKNIFNEVRATVTPWDLIAEAELWRLEEEPIIPVGESKTWWGNFDYFSPAIVTPVKTTDYRAFTGAGGTGTEKTDDITITTSKFAKSVKLIVANGADAPVYMYLLKVRGTYYDDQTKVTTKSEDSTSQTAYQKRTLELDGKYLTDADTAQNYCGYALGRYKDPQGEVTVTLQNKDDTNLIQILTRKISDRITVQNTKLGLNQDFFINKEEHEITLGGRLHICTWYLADATNEDFWCLDYSKLNVGTKIGY